MSKQDKQANIANTAQAHSDMNPLTRELYIALESAYDVETQGSSVADTILSIAKRCKNLDEFLEDCTTCELTFKLEHSATKMPRVWTKAKSTIKKGMKANKDISAFETERALRDELEQDNKSSSSSNTEVSSVVSELDATKEPEYGKINDALKAIHSLLKQLDNVPVEARAEAVARVELALLTAKSDMVDIMAEFTEIVGGEVIAPQQAKVVNA